MKVKELIEQLKNYDEDMQIEIGYEDTADGYTTCDELNLTGFSVLIIQGK